MKVALYVRVSTEEQAKHGLSVDNQIQALNDFSNEKGYEIVSLYNDAGFSGRKTYKKRPELQRLISDCEQNKVDLILFTKLDRWFRNVADYYEVQTILDKHNVKWQAIWEDYETITSSGVFKVNIMLSVAQNEADKTADRVRESVNYRKANGKFIGGHTPLGYQLVDHKMIKDPKQEKGVNAFFNSLITYGSLKKAMQAASVYGVIVTLDKAKTLRFSPVYYGKAYFESEPYITEEEHYKIIPKRQYIQTKRDFIFARLIYCHCGLVMTGQYQEYTSQKGKTTIYISYYCHTRTRSVTDIRHKPSRIKESDVENYLLENLDTLIEEYKTSISLGPSIDYIEIEKTKANLKAKLRRIGDRYEDGDIDRVEYTEKRQAILDQLKSFDISYPTEHKTIDIPSDWKDLYSSLDRLHKNIFWKSIIKKIQLDENNNISVYFF